ncbi:MAG: 50S ribosomal protein L15 [Candidatus Portnoybacteria bacterium]|nr:50S ribosomal protein L15 [Candidatus Portnoybacteria bacterium]
MQLHQILQTTKRKSRKRVGRGGKRGTYSGKGMKGQKSRSGAKIRPAWRDFVKKLPKQRGFKFKPINAKPVIINIVDIEKNFRDGDRISPQDLLSKGLIVKQNGRIPRVKILGKGEIEKKVTIKDCFVSASAKEKIEKAGGNIM